MTIANYEDGLGERLADFVGLSKDELPALRLLHPVPGGNPRKFRFVGPITGANIYKFYEDFAAGKLNPY